VARLYRISLTVDPQASRSNVASAYTTWASNNIYIIFKMHDLIRDSTIGQVLRFTAKNRVDQYIEETGSFELPPSYNPNLEPRRTDTIPRHQQTPTPATRRRKTMDDPPATPEADPKKTLRITQVHRRRSREPSELDLLKESLGRHRNLLLHLRRLRQRLALHRWNPRHSSHLWR